jgi:hypothetical protein
VDPSADDQSALDGACKNGHVRVVELLLRDKRVNPAVNHNAALGLAMTSNRAGVVRVLLQDARVRTNESSLYVCMYVWMYGWMSEFNCPQGVLLV